MHSGLFSRTLVGELVCFGHGEVGDTSTIRSGDEALGFYSENLVTSVLATS